MWCFRKLKIKFLHWDSCIMGRKKKYFFFFFLPTEKSAVLISASPPTSHTVTLSCFMSNLICCIHKNIHSSEDVPFTWTNWTVPFHASGGSCLQNSTPPGVWNDRTEKDRTNKPWTPSEETRLSVSIQSSSFHTLVLSEVRRHLRTRGARLCPGCDLILISHALASFHTWITNIKSTPGQAFRETCRWL